MSIYSGKLRRLDKLGGSLTDKKPQLRVEITPLNDVPKVTLSQRGGFSGAWERAGKFFGGAARPLSILYRFLAARVGVLNGRKAKAGTAPAQEIKADSAPVAGVDAPLIARPVQEVKVHARPHASVWAQLSAYNRAATVYIVKIFTGRLARAVAAPGVLAKYRKRVELELVSKAEAAGSAIMESRFNSFTSKDEALANSAPAEETAASVAFVAGESATASSAPTHDVNDQRIVNISVKAAPYMWFLPEQTVGTLSLFQVFSGVQSGNTLEIDMEAESVYWANAFANNGVLDLVFAAETTQTNNILEVE